MRLILGLLMGLMQDRIDQIRANYPFINKPKNLTIIIPLNLNIAS